MVIALGENAGKRGTTMEELPVKMEGGGGRCRLVLGWEGLGVARVGVWNTVLEVGVVAVMGVAWSSMEEATEVEREGVVDPPLCSCCDCGCGCCWWKDRRRGANVEGLCAGSSWPSKNVR